MKNCIVMAIAALSLCSCVVVPWGHDHRWYGPERYHDFSHGDWHR